MINLNLVVGALLLAPFCHAEEVGVQATRKVLERTINRGFEILQNESLDDAQRLNQFDALLTESCHLELMAKLALGKKAWTGFNTEEQEAFILRFRDLIKRSYYGKITQQDASSFAAEYGSNEKISDTKRALKVTMITRASRTEVSYNFYQKGGHWKIYDIEVEGVSLVASYRAQFNDFLAKHRPRELLAELAKAESEFQPPADATPGKSKR